MRTKEQILERLEELISDGRFDPYVKLATIEVLIDLRTNLKEISEQLKALRVDQTGNC